MGTSRSVVITGLGLTTPLGGDVATTWASLLAGRSGVRDLGADWPEDFPVRIAAGVAVDPAEVIAGHEGRRLDRYEQVCLIAARQAWSDAGQPDVDGFRLGVVMATGIGGVDALLKQYEVLKERGWSRVSPNTVPMIMPNGAAGWVGLEVGAQAGVHTPVSACASGAEAIALGARMIDDGRADVVVAGGGEACILPLTIAAFATMRALSTRNAEPERASRPYDKGRDGFVMGEGAGAVVLESEEHARARGATIYGRYAGAGMTSDGHHIAQPHPEGLGATRAIAAALAAADAAPGELVHVNAHATSTPQGDIAESVALREVLGDAVDGVAVTATKSMTGHLLGGAGAVESVFTVLSLHHRLVPPTINVDDPDDEIALDVVCGEPRPLPAGDLLALNNSFGFGGHNVALAFRSA
ncbi:MAG: beta-ketoacyl-[acyl-carrier-protein] synthase family protein [Actinomycetota bacterium]|nr:MAG: beta-ketoacyl-[acyl-carrier-protein] synthase family protein [Actinomycetota bacterium]